MTETDVAIIGGGINGGSTGLELAKNGLNVTIIDKNFICRGASGVNAGTLTMHMTRAQLIPYAKKGWELWMNTSQWLSKEIALAKKIRAARTKLGKVKVPEKTLEKIAALCLMLKTDGLRGELSLSKASRACAALNGSLSVTEAHVKCVAVMSLRHRLRRDPLDESSSDTRVKKMISEVFD